MLGPPLSPCQTVGMCGNVWECVVMCMWVRRGEGGVGEGTMKSDRRVRDVRRHLLAPVRRQYERVWDTTHGCVCGTTPCWGVCRWVPSKECVFQVLDTARCARRCRRRREGRERGKAQIGCGGYKSRGDACSQPYRAKVDILLVVFDAAAPPRRARCAASLLRAVRVNHTW